MISSGLRLSIKTKQSKKAKSITKLFAFFDAVSVGRLILLALFLLKKTFQKLNKLMKGLLLKALRSKCGHR
jgi:hypothetical protein